MAQTTRAIVVGVDDYAFLPLSSAVNDAVAVRDALIEAGLVAAAGVTLFAAPAPGQAAPAGSLRPRRQAILDALEPYYAGDLLADRLIVYFAGHGMTASPDGRVRESLVLPVDVASPTDGRNMICLDELLDLFEERGPLQQLWLVDACRDMPYQKRPRGYGIEWNEHDPQGQRAQVAIFAVAPGGEARSLQGGHGRFTDHLLAGLRGEGRAADYVRGRGRVVSAQSLHDYIAHRIDEGLQGWDDWTRAVQRPDIRPRGPLLAPLRDLPPAPARAFTVSVQPPQAEPAIEVALEVQAGLPVAGWPPSAPPAQYELRASLRPGMDEQGWGEPRPALSVVDLREQSGATIEVPYGPTVRGLVAPAPPGLAATAAGGFTELVTADRRGAGPPGAEATLEVQAGDEAARVRLRRLEHPWTVREGEPPNRQLTLEPGTWEARITIGDDTVAVGQLRLAAGEHRVLSSPAQITPVLAGLLPAGMPVSSTLMPSETIGPMQGAILPTLLPLLALKPYDRDNLLVHQLWHLQIPLIADDIGASMPGLQRMVAIAREGDAGAHEQAWVAGARALWTSADGKVSLHRADPDDRSASLRVHLAGRWIDIAAPSLLGGVTAVTLIAWPDGRLQSSVGLFRLPLGLAWPQPWGEDHFPPGRLARALALAAPLFRAGADLRAYPVASIDEFATAKWIDPVLGALAFHSCRSLLAGLPRDADPAAVAPLRALRDTIQANMARFFGALADSRIITALADDPARQRTQMQMLLDDAALGQPVLTASLAELAAAAIALGRDDHPAVDRFERIEPGQVFNLVAGTGA